MMIPKRRLLALIFACLCFKKSLLIYNNNIIIIQYYYYCERFEPRSHFKSRLSLIVQVNIVLNRTVVVDSD